MKSSTFILVGAFVATGAIVYQGTMAGASQRPTDPPAEATETDLARSQSRTPTPAPSATASPAVVAAKTRPQTTLDQVRSSAPCTHRGRKHPPPYGRRPPFLSRANAGTASEVLAPHPAAAGSTPVPVSPTPFPPRTPGHPGPPPFPPPPDNWVSRLPTEISRGDAHCSLRRVEYRSSGLREARSRGPRTTAGSAQSARG